MFQIRAVDAGFTKKEGDDWGDSGRSGGEDFWAHGDDSAELLWSEIHGVLGGSWGWDCGGGGVWCEDIEGVSGVLKGLGGREAVFVLEERVGKWRVLGQESAGQ
ncbi:hypothetical protein NC653_036357 [Populus alba x Populus x berolinensis]|uniref:Uncharacterized protein n=1 Tax=Populus alba x Populus x berolinensis TaxID=444605 RepID=A0AAD6LL56_9ROSI|nr:hypothetical protein NC653_036357 [Populus alba x Populus x berolinensis]